MKSLLILGAGGHGTVVKEVAEACGYDEIEFLDDTFPNAMGQIKDMVNFKKFEDAFVSIGNNKIRKQLMKQLLNNGFNIPTLIHPDAYVSKSVQIGKGSIIEPRAVINSNVSVGCGCIISIGAVVDHNALIKDYSHVNAGSIVKSSACVETFRRLEVGEIIYD